MSQLRGRRRHAVKVVAAVAVGGLALSGAWPASAGSHAHPRAGHAKHGAHHRAWRSGVFTSDTGFHTRADTMEFGRWRGDPVRMANDFAPSLGWRDLAGEKRVVDTWGGQRRIQLSLSVPMMAGNGSLATTAAGRSNRWFTALARNLVRGGLGHSVLRIGWEFNEAFYPWRVTSPYQASLYARAFRQIVRAVRAVNHEHFRFDWCSYNGLRGYRQLAQAYPGDRYVDYIGSDVYDFNQRGHHEPASVRWHDIVHSRSGLAWQAKFAKRHHKKLSYPEWALVSAPLQPGSGGGDDPAFIHHLWRWFSHHDVAYENYFDSVGLTGTSFRIDYHRLFPHAAAAYRHVWGTRTP